MALFSLRSQHTGTVREFTLLDLLNAMGDTVNDEIRLPDGNKENVFNLSSFQDLSGSSVGNDGGTGRRGTGGNSDNYGNSGATRLVNEALPISDGQQSINLGSAPVSICMLFLNGLKIRQGIDYNKSGRTIVFLNPLRSSVSQTDLLEALYDALAS